MNSTPRDPHRELACRCRHCGEENPPEFPNCWNCHESLADAIEIAPETPPVSEHTEVDIASGARSWIGIELLIVLLIVWLPGVAAGVEAYFVPPTALSLGAELFSILYNAGEVCLVAYLLWREGGWLAHLGLRGSRWLRDVPWAVLLALAAFAVTVFAFHIGSQWLPVTGGASPQADVPDEGSVRWILPGSSFVAALAEEVIFRAYVWRRLTQLLRDPILALIGSSALFSLVHVALVMDSIALFGFGLLLGWAFLRTSSLWRVTLAHWFYNLVLYYT